MICRQINQMVLTPQSSLPASSPASQVPEMASEMLLLIPDIDLTGNLESQPASLDCIAIGVHTAMLMPASAEPPRVPLHACVKSSGRMLHISGNTSPSSGKFVGDPHLLALPGELEGNAFEIAPVEGDCGGDSNRGGDFHTCALNSLDPRAPTPLACAGDPGDGLGIKRSGGEPPCVLLDDAGEPTIVSNFVPREEDEALPMLPSVA
jgi:hypothetical protein